MPANQAFNNVGTRKCEKELKDYYHTLEAGQEPCKMLIAPGDDKCFLSKKNAVLGHAGLKCIKLVEHLTANCAQMDESERIQTKDEMEKAWEGEPVEKLFAQVYAGMKPLEDNGSVFQDKDHCDLLCKLIDNSGLLPDAIKTWHHKP